MSIRRLIAVLGLGLVSMLAMVALRAETTRLEYELSIVDRRAESLLLELREKRLELARLSNPARIRQKFEELTPTSPPEEPARATSDEKKLGKPR